MGAGDQLRQGAGGLPGRMQAGDRFGEVIGSFDYLPEYGDVAPSTSAHLATWSAGSGGPAR